jgi:hypothetical protein
MNLYTIDSRVGSIPTPLEGRIIFARIYHVTLGVIRTGSMEESEVPSSPIQEIVLCIPLIEVVALVLGFDVKIAHAQAQELSKSPGPQRLALLVPIAR